MPPFIPRIVGLGGTTRPGSSTERALRYALRLLEERGARTSLLAGDELALPMYAPHEPARSAQATRLVAELRRADAVLIASPGYHGSMSGLVKNALDYTEDMRGDAQPYLAGRAVGCIVTAAGWQAAVTTLGALRDTIHALRGWPTPFGVCLGGDPAFDAQGECIDPRVEAQMGILCDELMTFAQRFHTSPCTDRALAAA